MKINTVRIALNQLQIGMVCSEDIYSSSGLLLIGKNVPITQTHLFRLKLYQIFYVSVYNDPKILPEASKESYLSSHKHKETPAYTAFKIKYEQTLEHLDSLICSLIRGEDVSEELFLCCNELFLSLPDADELFDYLYYLEHPSEKEAIIKHCLNVGLYCLRFAAWLGLDSSETKALTLAGLLHDIGKFEISDEIINKPGKLNEDEFTAIKQHPLIGYEKIRHSALPYSTKISILQHHEKMDGSGYPFAFQNKEIHDFAKIVSIIDIYDAMTSERTYHKQFSPFCVFSILEKDGYHILDSQYLSIFLENISSFYRNRTILLSNGETGKIIFVNREFPSRPIVQAGSSIYNLEFELDLNIVDLV